jgi:hypothetical protein
MDDPTKQQITGHQELAPYLACHGANPSAGWPPEGWPRSGWPPAGWCHGEGGGTDWLPEEHYNAALWESS